MTSRQRFWIKTSYFSFFAGFGIFLVYLNLYYKRIGLSAQQIGVLSALYPCIGILVNPIWGLLADGSPDPRRILRRLLTASALLFGVLFFFSDFGLIFLVMIGFAVCFSPIMALIDALTLGALVKYGGDYGRVRLWGSLGFMFPALTLWALLNWRDDLRVIFPLFVLCTLIAVAILGRYPFLERSAPPRLNFTAFRLLRDPIFLLFLGTGFLQKLAMSGYYSFFSIYLDELGRASSEIGFFWGIGPIAETVSLFIAGGCIARWGVKRMLLVSHAATALRMGLLSLAPPIGVIVGTQLLHALTFGTFHAASLHYLARKATEENRSSVQALYAAICYQLSMVVGHSLAGVLVEHWGLCAMFRTYGIVALVALVVFALGFPERGDEPRH